ncbi:MAG: iron ABC transporter permease, partial [Rhodobacteraceae bacterium]|nr:iron ABC transporter permease [Paracoccaceae bacterium]
MADIQFADHGTRRRATGGTRALAVVAYVVAAMCLLPMLAVGLAAITGGDTGTITHLIDTVLPRYTLTTLILIVLVATGTFAIGVGAAWLVTMTRFPGVRMLEIALVLPLAFPAYVLAYAYTFVLDHPGIVQSTL